MVELAGIPEARAGEDADANEPGPGGHGDGKANDAAVVDDVDAHRQRDALDHFRRRHRLRSHRLRLDVGADVVRQVPHILDHQAVHAAFDQRFRVPQGMVNDGLHPVAGIAGRARQGPQVHHADDGLGDAKKLLQGFQARTIHLLFPLGSCFHLDLLKNRR